MLCVSCLRDAIWRHVAEKKITLCGWEAIRIVKAFMTAFHCGQDPADHSPNPAPDVSLCP